MSEDDKAIFKMIADYLQRAVDSINELSPEGQHILSVVVSEFELPHEGDLETLITQLRKIAKGKAQP